MLQKLFKDNYAELREIVNKSNDSLKQTLNENKNESTDFICSLFNISSTSELTPKQDRISFSFLYKFYDLFSKIE